MIANNASASAARTCEIRLAGPRDLASMVELLPELDGASYSQRFPGQTCADFIRWKYFQNPAGDACVGVALDGERVVSIVAGTPKRVRLGNEVVLAFELGDFITAADHRKRGLFSALINLVCDAAQQRGAALTYVRPNDVSFPILASRLSFAEPGKIEMRRYVELSGLVERKLGVPASLLRGLGADWITRKVAIPAASGSIRVDAITRFESDVDRLWECTQDQFGFSLVRDSRYLNWRHVECPTPYRIWRARRQEQMAGYLVAFIPSVRSIATILDLYTHPADEEAAAALLNVAVKDMLRAGTQVVYTWRLQSGADSASSRLLKRTCKFVSKPLLHFAVRPLKGRTVQDLPAARWQLTAGDFDGF
jgi:GNAT superfamily N-acetyltransferase